MQPHLMHMSLKELKHNSVMANQLSRLISSERTVHAFLFIGSSEERLELGREFAKAILCSEGSGDSCGKCLSCRKFDHGNHEDFILVERPENKQSILVGQIEELQEKLIFKAFGEKRVAIISDAHLMNAQAQNKLLKTLEEPAEGTVLILLADSRENLLPTILSRCSCYYLQESAGTFSAEAKDMAKQFALLVTAQAPFYKKKDCLKPILSSKDDARTKGIEFLCALEEELRQILLDGNTCSLDCLTNAFAEMEEALKNLKLSYNTAYVLKNMCLRI